MPKLRLGINIDHIATVRNARNRDADAAPDLLRAAREAIKGGADGITFHLREDRRHVLDADVKHLCKNVTEPINLEMAATEEMKNIALRLRPHAVCLVPEKRKEVTTEGGLDAVKGGKKLACIVNELAAAGIRVSLFINPEAAQILAAWTSGAAAIELHTGTYANAKGSAQKRELKRLQWAATQAHKLGLEVHAGHGLTYDNVGPIAAIPEIAELNIGHFLVGDALFVGFAASVRQMRKLMDKARK
ncbi:MAG: pyridoxine 5'-phosphate synthase [Alphaproteobacteria bacterium]|nr:pyridoxine 5'-phosphate synthase [Alphaproteobacteria bacterium]